MVCFEIRALRALFVVLDYIVFYGLCSADFVLG